MLSGSGDNRHGYEFHVDKDNDGAVVISFSGKIGTCQVQQIWPKLQRHISKSHSDFRLDASEVESANCAFLAMIAQCRKIAQKNGADLQVTGLKEQYQQLCDTHAAEKISAKSDSSLTLRNRVENTGRAFNEIVENLKEQISMAGELAYNLSLAIFKPRIVRWSDFFVFCRLVAARAFGIVALLGFLIGVILAFQSMVFMRKYGAGLYVADLVSASILRELGPLMTAVIVAGRSGSAFAAELGTMKVNEELDALYTMGLDPARFLVLSRVLAATVALPLLTIFMDFFGVLGGGIIMRSFGYPVVTYMNQVLGAVGMSDFLGGVVKSTVFGLLIGAVGCINGLQTGSGARAVGISATRAVVSGIILIIIADGIFAVAFYHLGI